MRRYIIRITLLSALFLATVQFGFAQQSSKVDSAVNQIVKKYENTKGINCISVVKGGGLEFFKMALKKEFGKSFMKGVTSITIIDYSDASEDTCQSLRKELDVFESLLNDYNLSEEKEFSDNEYIRCFACENGDRLSDFVVALENESSKTVMYMAGEIIVE